MSGPAQAGQALVATVIDPFVMRQQWELLKNLVARQLKVRYRRSILGMLWTFLNPILIMIVLTVVFSTLFSRNVPHFPVYFLAAYLTFHFFSQTTAQAMNSMVRNATLYKRLRVPKHVFVLADVGANLINFILTLIPLAVLMVLQGVPFTPAVLFLPVCILLLGSFTVGVSLFLAALAVFFDDITQFYQVLMLAAMYLSALFYPPEIVPAKYRIFLEINPLFHFVRLMREPIYYGRIPQAEHLLVTTVAALVALAVGTYVFVRSSDRFLYYV